MINSNSNLSGKVIGTCMLESPIGRGGMSVVYRAQQVQPIQRQVAVKILFPEASTGSELHHQFLARFKREAQIIAKLHHPNIIPLYEYGEQDGEVYLVMPYLAGGSLSKILSRRRVLTLHEALNYIEQAAAALDYAHMYKVIHRDLKPSNFLIDSDGRLVLADFGIARIMRESGRTIVSTLTNPGALIGTPDYMSPEMVQGEKIDHRSDIYELGIVLFQMLSGHVPFTGSTPSIFTKHLYEPLPLLHPTNPGIPPAVDDVIQKATAKRREDRFASAGAMATALRTAMTSPANYSRKGTVNYAPTVLATMATPSTFDPHALTSNQSATSKTVEQYPPELSGSNKPSSVHKQPGKVLAIFLIIIAFMLVIGTIPLGLWIAGMQQGQTKPTYPLAFQQAKEVVQQYYDDFNYRDYQAAFNLIVTTRTPCSFTDGYSHTLNSKITFENVTQNADGTIKVSIKLNATENISEGTVARVYQTYHTVQKVNNTWKIVDDGDLNQIGKTSIITPAAPPIPSSSQAQNVIQQYYYDISHQDYKDAYNLWGIDYHNFTTYCQFVSNHVQILHDDIVSFGDMIQMADGTTQMTVTVQETRETRAGEVTSVYHESYNVGQENTSWKILSVMQ